MGALRLSQYVAAAGSSRPLFLCRRSHSSVDSKATKDHTFVVSRHLDSTQGSTKLVRRRDTEVSNTRQQPRNTSDLDQTQGTSQSTRPRRRDSAVYATKTRLPKKFVSSDGTRHPKSNIHNKDTSRPWTARMAVEGVFAITKPKGISSAQVIRDVQAQFEPSKLFKPWLEREQARRDLEAPHEKRKRSRAKRVINVKIGHGGTLDPMATGILILGIGAGTKSLQPFMTECRKTYEAVVLFGAATDTYDTEGKVLARKPYEHITREAVEHALAKFRGKGKQKPPIYSALRVNGKRLYEYARAGKELPIEIKERDVEVFDLEMLEWMDGGKHEWQWPKQEAVAEEKIVGEKVLHASHADAQSAADESENSKRKLEVKTEPSPDAEAAPASKRAKLDEQTNTVEGATSEQRAREAASASASASASIGLNASATSALPEVETALSTESAVDRPACPAPACRIRMSVTSGFYVRSLAHDLGIAVGSHGIMSELARTKQADFELGKSVLDYDLLAKGEDAWAPRVSQLLEEWHEKVS